jgi:hypothetical protein
MYGHWPVERVQQDKELVQISYQSRMTGIFKSRCLKIGPPMKCLGLVSLLMLLGMASSGTVIAELTASQQVPHSAAVGETVMATVVLVYSGYNTTEAIVTPGLPPGLVSDMPGSQTAELYPGTPASISYPFRAEQRGSYLIVSDIAYSEEGTWRDLRLEAPFTAIGRDRDMPQPAPAPPLQLQNLPGTTGSATAEPDILTPGGNQPSTGGCGMLGPGGNEPMGNEPGEPSAAEGNPPEGPGVGTPATGSKSPDGGAPESPP